MEQSLSAGLARIGKHIELKRWLDDPLAMGQTHSSDDRGPSVAVRRQRELERWMAACYVQRNLQSTKYSAYEKVEKMLSEYVSNTWYTTDTSELKLYLQAISADERFELLKKKQYGWLGYTALYKAAEIGDTEVMRCLLEMVEPQKRYELLKIQHWWSGETPLHAAASRGRTEVMRCMLELVEPEKQIQLLDIPNESNQTSLDVAEGEETVQLIRQYRESAVREIVERKLRLLKAAIDFPEAKISIQQLRAIASGHVKVVSAVAPDNQKSSLSLQQKSDKMSPRENLSYVCNDLSLEERESLMSDERQRRKTFLVNWPHDNLSGVKMAQAGFYCVDDYDRVQCAFCRGSLHKWKAEDNPMTEHAKVFPFCRFVKGLECGNKEYKNELPLAEMKKNRYGSVSTNSGAFGISTNKAAAIKYAPYETRKNTYGRWPAADVIRPERLCEAGFYYTGFNDQVRCFYCSGTLKDWKSGDEPFEEHARWFPDCSYLLQLKGEKYIDEVHVRTEDHKKCLRKTVLQKKTEKEWKQQVSIQQAMYELIVVKLNHDRRAVDIAINRNGKTFESVKEMLEAVYQVEEDGNMDSDRMETTSLVPDNLKWIYNPSLHGISSAVPPPPSYLTDVLCYTSGRLSDTHSHVSLDLLRQLDEMRPQEYRAAVRDRLLPIQLHWLMSMEWQRRKSFLDNWPHAGSLSGERMAQAGFYYSGDNDDSVRCVFCGVVINSWDAKDNPMAEHRKWFPLCWFVQDLDCGNRECQPVQPTDAHPAPIQEGQPGAG